MTNKYLLILWCTVALSLFTYSYGFVDFNLTLSSHPVVMNFVSWSQSLALFNRSLSLNVYLAFTSLLFILYGLTIKLWKGTVFPWKWVLLTATIFALAYPFLSSDVFKYLFTGKIIAYYRDNPYLHSPDYFTGDLWLRFMRWVHTPTPYGPVFSILAVPYYYLGLGKFVPILYLFKLSQIGWYALSIWCVGKLSKSVRAQILFALNPLILIEWLTNAHNDAIMISLMLLAMYLLTRAKRVGALASLLLSIGVKYVTVIMAPFIFMKKQSVQRMSWYALILLTLAPLLYKYSFQYQPWYVTWLVPFAAILGNPYLIIVVSAYSLGSFLRYIPYISTGLWIGTEAQFALYSFGPPLIVVGIMLIKRAIKTKR